MTAQKLMLTLVPVLLVQTGCRCGKPPPTEEEVQVQKQQARRREKTRKPQQRAFLAGAQILIAFAGAQGAGPTVKRSKEQARQLAVDLASRLKRNPSMFEDLARKHSDSPTASFGGNLGAWPRGKMPPELERALDALQINEVSEPLETPRGYQILLRRIAVLSASQIVVSHKAVKGAWPRIKRDRKQAEALAQKLSTELQRDPTRFFNAAQKHSDDLPSARLGGRMGKWTRGRKPKEIEDTIDQLEIGQVSRPVDTRQGYVVLRRDDPYPGN
jgi:parvulin-like peptidyl-prolyl isomerase